MAQRVLTDDGIALNCVVEGRVDGRPLLLSNSLGTDVSMWDAQIASLAPHFRIARYDARGHGASDVPDGYYSIERLGRDALAIADQLGWERFDFAGVSLGGMTGLWLGINAPERLHHAIIANAGPFTGGPTGWAERSAAVQSGGMAAIADGVIGRWFTPAFAERSPETVAAVRRRFLAMSPAGYAGCCAALGSMDLRPGLATIKVPTLLIGGAHDTTPPPAAIAGMAAQMADARTLILEAAHLSNIEAADAFNAAILDFVCPTVSYDIHRPLPPSTPSNGNL